MRARAMVWAALAAAALAGCDWRDFDNLRNSTPVTAIEAPSGWPSSNDFAQLVVATAPPRDGSASARFVTSGIVQTALAVVTLDAGGHASSRMVNPTSGLSTLSDQPVTAMAAIPGTDKVLLGVAPPQAIGSVLVLDMSVSPETVTPFAGISPTIAAELGLGVGVAAGNVDSNPAADLIVASNSTLHVFLNGGLTDVAATSSPSCPIALSTSVPTGDRVQRAIAIGNFTGAGPVIAIGTPGVGASGTVSFFQVDSTGTTLACLFSLSPPTMIPDFGRALGVASTPHPDLLVGAPPKSVFVYAVPITAGAPVATTVTQAGGQRFGASLAMMSETGLDFWLVGDPGATVNGQQLAGDAVWMRTDMANQQTLSDHSAGAGNAYGSSVAALTFCPAPPCTFTDTVQVVGAANQAFVYFTLFPEGDPRK
jgi:hypothetical protein